MMFVFFAISFFVPLKKALESIGWGIAIYYCGSIIWYIQDGDPTFWLACVMLVASFILPYIAYKFWLPGTVRATLEHKAKKEVDREQTGKMVQEYKDKVKQEYRQSLENKKINSQSKQNNQTQSKNK